MTRLVLSFAVAAAAACSSETAGTGECSDNTGCEAGEVCSDGACQQLCVADRDCADAGTICQMSVCVPGGRTAPVVVSIDGDGMTDGIVGHAPNQVTRRVTLTGENFEGAVVTLSDGANNWDLEVCSVTDTELVVELPDGIAASSQTPTSFTLQVANQGGSCDATLPILQGETGPAGPTGPVGPTGPPGVAGPPPTEMEIQTAVTNMMNLDVGLLGGRGPDGYQRTDLWGRFFDTELPPVAGNADLTASQVVMDTTAVRGEARLVPVPAMPMGSTRIHALHSTDLGEELAPGRARLEYRMKIADRTAMGPDFSLTCSHDPNGMATWTGVGSRVVRPAEFLVSGEWQTFSIDCAFVPNQENQFAGLEITYPNGTMASQFWVDWMRITPITNGDSLAASAARTNYVLHAGGQNGFDAIPGLSVTFHLAGTALVQMSASGIQRTTAGGTTTCHNGYRFVVDGTPGGHATWGQGIQVSRADVAWWSMWDIENAQVLGPGPHTIRAEVNADGDCIVCGETGPAMNGYDDCHLNVLAIYQ